MIDEGCCIDPTYSMQCLSMRASGRRAVVLETEGNPFRQKIDADLKERFRIQRLALIVSMKYDLSKDKYAGWIAR